MLKGAMILLVGLCVTLSLYNESRKKNGIFYMVILMIQFYSWAFLPLVVEITNHDHEPIGLPFIAVCFVNSLLAGAAFWSLGYRRLRD